MQFGEALGPGEAHAIMTAAAEEGQAALAAAAAGGNNSKSPFLALDTAEAYPVPMAGRTSGDSERIIGDWLRAGSAPGKGSSRRERTVLITKVSGPGDQPWIRGGPPRLDGDHFKRALEGSLRRLRVDELEVSPWALREGVILRRLDSEADGTALVASAGRSEGGKS